MKTSRIFVITSNNRYGKALRLHLENEHTADLQLADTVETEVLTDGDSIVLDAHALSPRSKCTAVQHLRAVREQDIGTPFVILTWLPRREIVNAQLAGNPFIGHFYRDSCRFLQLPVRPEQLVESLKAVRPCTKEEIATGKRHLVGIDHAHPTSSR